MTQGTWNLRKRIRTLEKRIDSALAKGAMYDDDYVQNLVEELDRALDEYWDAKLPEILETQ